MQSRLLNRGTPQTYALVFETGEDPMAGLLGFAREKRLTASTFSAIGAFERATLGFFDFERKDYIRIPVGEQSEVVSLTGNIARKDGEPKLHIHAVLGKRDGSTVGGHLLEARVKPTLEVVILEAPAHLARSLDETTGLPLLDLGRQEGG